MMRIQNYVKFLKYVKKYWLQELLLCLLLFLTTMASLSTPYFLKVIIDDILPNRNMAKLIYFLQLLSGIYVLKFILSYLFDVLYTQVTNKIIRDLRTDLFMNLLARPLEFFNEYKVGELVHKINNEVEKVQNALSHSIIRLLNNLLLMIGITIFLVQINPSLFFLSVSIYPLLLLNMKYFTPKIKAFYEKISQKEADIHHFFSERFDNIRAVKIFNASGFERIRLSEKVEAYMANDRQQSINTSLHRNFTIFLMSVGPLIVFGFGGNAVMKGTMTIGALVAFIQYLNRLYGPSMDMVNLHSDILRVSVSLDQIFDLFDHRFDNSEDQLSFQSPAGPVSNLIVNDLTFNYKGKDVLKKIDFEFKAGRIYGLVGNSGCGKSTLINLISQLYTPENGSITIDGKDAAQMGRNQIAGLITLISSENQIFNDTVSANVTYGTARTTSELSRFAMEQTGLLEVCAGLAEGDQTMVGNNGSKFSAGQLQRIALSRLFLRNTPVVILDEATSALDANAEAKIIENIRLTGKDKIIILISHRLSAMNFTDEILVLGDGRILENGSHAALLAGKGHYYELFKNQVHARQMI